MKKTIWVMIKGRRIPIKIRKIKKIGNKALRKLKGIMKHKSTPNDTKHSAGQIALKVQLMGEHMAETGKIKYYPGFSKSVKEMREIIKKTKRKK